MAASPLRDLARRLRRVVLPWVPWSVLNASTTLWAPPKALLRQNRLIMRPARQDRIETGGGRSVAAIAAGTLPMAAVPLYSRLETVQRMGTS